VKGNINFSNILNIVILIAISITFSTCGNKTIKRNDGQISIAFGSCDNQRLTNNLWTEVNKHKPAIWIWGGDNVYCDTENMDTLKACYDKKLNDPAYKQFISDKMIIGTWDDHDYGKNDGGEEYIFKKQSQKLFFEFMKDAQKYHNENQEGVYYSVDLPKNKLKIIVLDTRYFRTPLTIDPAKVKRFIPASNGSMLGEKQWNWLENQLKNSKAELNIIVSSIQFLSSEHGFEMWANMPDEQKRLEKLLVDSKVKGAIFISGDRHISEFSQKKLDGLPYPLVDFTSSGLTHSYRSFSGEPNKYRLGNATNFLSFGLIKWNPKSGIVELEIRGIANTLISDYKINFKEY
jgi:alkaline phosphatase D